MSATAPRRRRALRAAAPIAGLLAAGLLVWQGSYAAFSATTDNGSESWNTGQLTLVNSPGTGVYAASTTPVFADTNLVIPSATVTKCITVKAGGTLGGTLNFYRGTLTGSAPLANQISLTIKRSAATAADPNDPGRLRGLRFGRHDHAGEQHAERVADDVRHRPRRRSPSRLARSSSCTSSHTRSCPPAATPATTPCRAPRRRRRSTGRSSSRSLSTSRPTPAPASAGCRGRPVGRGDTPDPIRERRADVRGRCASGGVGPSSGPAAA